MLHEFLIADTASRRFRVFLSFVTEDKPLVDDFKLELESRYPNLLLLDHVVQDRYDRNWKRGCAEKIDQSTLLICLIGTTTHRSEPVAWEIDRGLSHGKRVVAFNLMDHPVRVPDVLVTNSITLLPYTAIYAT